MSKLLRQTGKNRESKKKEDITNFYTFIRTSYVYIIIDIIIHQSKEKVAVKFILVHLESYR